jgi:hypothetical protein
MKTPRNCTTARGPHRARPARNVLAVPAALQLALIAAACGPDTSRADAQLSDASDSGSDTVDVAVSPATCDASMPGLTCYSECILLPDMCNGAQGTMPCTVFCPPIPSGEPSVACVGSLGDAGCMLAAVDGGVEVHCAPC